MILSAPRVMHILANSAPDLNGYAIRSHDLLVSLKDARICDPLVLTSPYYPERVSMCENAVIDGIEYHRSASQSKKFSESKQRVMTTPERKSHVFQPTTYLANKLKFLIRILCSPIYSKLVLFGRFLRQKRLMKKFEKEITSHIRLHEPCIIHAHTPFRVGLPALRAAKKLGIPFVYEVRGMWEDSAVAQGRWTTKSIPYRYYRRQENKVIKNADEVIAIGENLGKELVRRQLRNRAPSIIPNAVGRGFASYPLNFSARLPENVSNLVRRLRLKESTIVIGYIGSLRTLEGVDFTAKAVALCAKTGLDLRFLVCSSEANQNDLKQLCSDLGIGDKSFIEGPYPHEEIVHYYDLIDIFIVSRPDTNVTRIVPPIKPLEAMVRAKPTIVSNLPALCEIVENGVTGVTFPSENVQSLAAVITDLSSSSQTRKKLGQTAREYVLEKRTWPEVVHNYQEIYQRYS